MDFARSHNAHENHKGHKFCVGRVRFGIFWPTDWTNHRSLTLWICLVFKTKFLKPTGDTTCEGKSEMKCAGQMQNKKWNDTVKLSCLNLTQFLKQHETFPPDPVLTFATFAKKIHALVIMPRWPCFFPRLRTVVKFFSQYFSCNAFKRGLWPT